MDVLNCPVIEGDRSIFGSSATSLVNPALTRAEGYLSIQANNALTRVNFPSLTHIGGGLQILDNGVLTHVDFASLSSVGGSLQILFNNALTFASFPLRTEVQSNIAFCQNNAAFLYPRGLTSTQYKEQEYCVLQNGAGPCGTFVECP
jgi:hypothetical protein